MRETTNTRSAVVANAPSRIPKRAPTTLLAGVAIADEAGEADEVEEAGLVEVVGEDGAVRAVVAEAATVQARAGELAGGLRSWFGGFTSFASHHDHVHTVYPDLPSWWRCGVQRRLIRSMAERKDVAREEARRERSESKSVMVGRRRAEKRQVTRARLHCGQKAPSSSESLRPVFVQPSTPTSLTRWD